MGMRLKCGSTDGSWTQPIKKIISPQDESTITRVSELFYLNTRIWDLGKLEESFYPWEAELVSRIQVGKGRDEELFAWPLTVDGTYGVRSAFRFLASTKVSNSPSSSTGTEQQSLWKKKSGKYGLLIRLDT